VVVGSRLYNRFIWGAAVKDYRAFAVTAVSSSPTGPLLDAACGSMLFSAEAHSATRRLVVACDQSIDMLRRARARLMRRTGFPNHVVLLQADVIALPFKPGVFRTVLCMNVLHHVERGEVLLKGLRDILAVGGSLRLTSLALADRAVGDRFLRALQRRGEFARPRSLADIGAIMRKANWPAPHMQADGNMAYVDAMR
jgi:ubiquinone/menaquinone biosynthesis C-methylase UbiE